jgi:iron(III) transport system substrate-binding protein
MKRNILSNLLAVTCALVLLLLLFQAKALASDAALVEAAKKEGKFVLYTSLPTDAAVALLTAFKDTYPFLDTSEFFRSTSYKTYSRFNIEAEAEKHIADCVSIALWHPYPEWKEKGWLMKYDSPNYKDIPKAVQDPGYFAALRAVSMVMAYNTTILSKDDVPTTWTDLLDPKWKGQIGVEGTDSGSQHMQYYLFKNVYGEDYWDKLLNNEPRIFSGQGAMFTALLRGEIKVTMHGQGYMIYRYRELEGAPVQGVWPADCVPMYAGPVALTATAPHPNAAKLFMDWILSKEGQEAMVKNVGAYSPRADVSPATGNPPMKSFKPVFIEDWEAFGKSTDAFKKAWERIKR